LHCLRGPKAGHNNQRRYRGSDANCVSSNILARTIADAGGVSCHWTILKVVLKIRYQSLHCRISTVPITFDCLQSDPIQITA
jgi:hypothetical protein